MMYGMRKTTLYLPDHLKEAVEQAAARNSSSEASFIRQALERAVASARPPRPRLPLFSSKDPDLAERIEQELDGFGES